MAHNRRDHYRNVPQRGPFPRNDEFEDDQPPRGPRPGPSRGRSNPATKKYQRTRNEAYREKKSDEFQKDLKDKIKEKLHANTDEET